jgi:hypothetical protein
MRIVQHLGILLLQAGELAKQEFPLHRGLTGKVFFQGYLDGSQARGTG